MNLSDYISLLALITSIVFGYINYRHTKKQFRNAVTPVLASKLSFTQNYNKAGYVVISTEKSEQGQLYFYDDTDLTLRMKNLSNTLSITGIKWKLEYAKQYKRWLPVKFWLNSPLIATIPDELNPLEEKICILDHRWETLASLILPNSIEEVTQQDNEGKARKYFIAKAPISIFIRLTISYKAGLPNSEYMALRQEYRIVSVTSGYPNESGIVWHLYGEDNADNMIDNPGKIY
ncbi:MAG: hypothetical protein HS124_07080 [Anaerolineales bacterium]|nr:hypothetical protein [Anaerolineales bacterium]